MVNAGSKAASRRWQPGTNPLYRALQLQHQIERNSPSPCMPLSQLPLPNDGRWLHPTPACSRDFFQLFELIVSFSFSRHPMEIEYFFNTD